MLKRTGNISKEQKRQLVDFMEEHPELSSAKFTKNFTFQSARSLWQELENGLNALPGATKTWQQWRKTWHDLRSTAKSKRSTIIKLRQQTGGGSPPNEALDDTEEKILNIIGPTAISGHTNTLESEVKFVFDEIDNDKDDNETLNLEQEIVMIDDCANLTEDVMIDHLYSTPSTSQTHSLNATGDPCLKTITHSPGTSGSQRMYKKGSRVRRLEETVSATAKLADQCERKINLKENYYTKKLQLYEVEIETKKRIAKALEEIVHNFENNQ